MSVPKDSRKKAEADYVMAARELLLYTLSRYNAMSDKLKNTVGEAMKDSAWVIYNNVSYANSIKVIDLEDYKERYRCLVRAGRELKCFAPKMEIAQEFIYVRRRELKRQADYSENMSDRMQYELKMFEKSYNFNWNYWADLVRNSIALVNGVIRSDKKRYSHLKK